MNKSIVVMTESRDKSSTLTIEFCKMLAGDGIAIDRIDLDRINKGNVSIRISNTLFSRSIKDVEIEAYDFVWFRRPIYRLPLPVINEELKAIVGSQLKKEYQILGETMFLEDLSGERTLGSYYAESKHNKLTDLLHARNCGLKVPDTLVSTCRRDLEQFMSNYDSCITKPISNVYNSTQNMTVFFSKATMLCEPDYLKKLDDLLYPTLLQEFIHKIADVRVFCLVDRMYAMIIYSQESEKTKIDYRNYDIVNPNRLSRFRLPDQVKRGIRDFMNLKGLDTASLDFVVTKSGDIYFLEANPSGQFGWLSFYCNYNVEYDIAKVLLYGKDNFRTS